MQAVQGVANVAGAAVAPSMETGAAFDKNLATVPEQELKNFLASQSGANLNSADGIMSLDSINKMDLKALRDAYVKSFTADQLSDPNFLGKIYTPQSTR